MSATERQERLEDNPQPPAIERTVVLNVRDDGPKGYYGPGVELLLMDDGTVRWRYDRDY